MTLLPKCLGETETWQAFPIVARTSLCEHYSLVAISVFFFVTQVWLSNSIFTRVI